MLTWEMDRAGCILTDKRLNSQAQETPHLAFEWCWACKGPSQKGRRAKPDNMFADYLLTVIQGDTDSLPTHKPWAEILNNCSAVGCFGKG